MANPASKSVRSLPPVVRTLASIVIVFHLFALGIVVIAAPSGPWTVPFSSMPPSQATPPPFASAIAGWTTGLYLQPLGLACDFHFNSNRTMFSTIRFEAHLTDSDGRETVLHFPDPNANAAVRYRQSLLAQNLGEDMQILPKPPGEAIPPDVKSAKKVFFFYPVFREGSTAPDPKSLELCETYEHLVPREPLFRPGEWSLILTRSFARYLQSTHNAQKVEIVRLNRNPVMPELMLPNRMMPGRLLVDNPPFEMDLETKSANFYDGENKKWWQESVAAEKKAP